MDYVQLTTYVVVLLLLVVIISGMIQTLVCDCKECTFFKDLPSSDDPDARITALLQPFTFSKIWPFCYLAAVIITPR